MMTEKQTIPPATPEDLALDLEAEWRELEYAERHHADVEKEKSVIRLAAHHQREAERKVMMKCDGCSMLVSINMLAPVDSDPEAPAVCWRCLYDGVKTSESQRITTLEAALREYGEHKPICQSNDYYNAPAGFKVKAYRPCNCGYKAALTQTEENPTDER